jgi:hypothetical protein
VDETRLAIACPFCEREHEIRATEDGAFDEARGLWQWNRSMDAPTFWPSLWVEWPGGECHTWIVDGWMRKV